MTTEIDIETNVAMAITERLNRLPAKCTVSGYLATGGAIELAATAMRIVQRTTDVRIAESRRFHDSNSPKHNDRIDVGGALVEAYRKEIIRSVELERELETRASAYAHTIEENARTIAESARVIAVQKAEITKLETELYAFNAAEEEGG